MFWDISLSVRFTVCLPLIWLMCVVSTFWFFSNHLLCIVPSHVCLWCVTCMVWNSWKACDCWNRIGFEVHTILLSKVMFLGILSVLTRGKSRGQGWWLGYWWILLRRVESWPFFKMSCLFLLRPMSPSLKQLWPCLGNESWWISWNLSIQVYTGITLEMILLSQSLLILSDPQLCMLANCFTQYDESYGRKWRYLILRNSCVTGNNSFVIRFYKVLHCVQC